MLKSQYTQLVQSLAEPALVSAFEIEKHFAAGTRPYQVVNLTVPGVAVSAEDELEQLGKAHTFFLGEGPACCGKCGSRTDFEIISDGVQHHKCLNTIYCGFEFIGEDEDQQLRDACAETEI